MSKKLDSKKLEKVSGGYQTLIPGALNIEEYQGPGWYFIIQYDSYTKREVRGPYTSKSLAESECENMSNAIKLQYNDVLSVVAEFTSGPADKMR